MKENFTYHLPEHVEQRTIDFRLHTAEGDEFHSIPILVDRYSGYTELLHPASKLARVINLHNGNTPLQRDTHLEHEWPVAGLPQTMLDDNYLSGKRLTRKAAYKAFFKGWEKNRGA